LDWLRQRALNIGILLSAQTGGLGDRGRLLHAACLTGDEAENNAAW